MVKKEKLNSEVLANMFNFAIKNKIKFCAMEIENTDYKKSEIIINPMENFKDKFDYYMCAYDDELILKACRKIRIKNAVFSNDLNALIEEIF